MPGRNEPCVCGSGKKYKKCCLTISAPALVVSSERENELKIADHCMFSGDLENAEAAFRRVLKTDKQSIAALVGLGQCLCQQLRNNEGIPFILQAGKHLIRHARKTRDVRQILDLAFLLCNMQAPEKALSYVDAALLIDPNFPRAHHTKALALQRLDPLKAYVSAKKAVMLAPDESNAVILLALLEAKQGDFHLARKRLQNLIVLEDEAIDLPRVHLELGVIYDKLGEYEQAFSCFVESGRMNQKRPQVQHLDQTAVYHDLQISRQVFDADFFKNCSSKINDNLSAPVFLIGFYRSGTTLMEQILGAHPKVLTSDEAYIIPAVAKQITKISTVEGSIQEKIKALSQEQIGHLRQFYWQTAEQVMGQGLSQKVFIDKTAMNTLNLGLINTIFPDAILLFAIRDPRDVCLSCFMQAFELSPLTVHFLDFFKGVQFYALVMEYWLLVRHMLSTSWLELRYEDILDDMEGVFRPVFEIIGLEWDVESERFYKHAQQKTVKTPSFDQVTKPLYWSSVQRWKNYEQQIQGVENILQHFVRDFAYGDSI